MIVMFIVSSTVSVGNYAEGVSNSIYPEATGVISRVQSGHVRDTKKSIYPGAIGGNSWV